jgi:hypothetical protein
VPSALSARWRAAAGAARLYGRNRGIASLLGRPEPLLRARGILLNRSRCRPLGIQRPPAHPLLKLSGLPHIALPRQLALEFGALGARLLLGTVSAVDRVPLARLGLLGAPLRGRALALDALAVLPRSRARPGRPVVDFYGTRAAARADALGND